MDTLYYHIKIRHLLIFPFSSEFVPWIRTMDSTNVLERVENALKNDDDQLLRQIYSELSVKIQICAFVSDRSFHRDFDVEVQYCLETT